MTKVELSTVIEEEMYNKYHLKITPQEVSQVLDIAMQTIITAVAEGDTVTLRGFGSFEPKARKAKPARNIRTGQSIIIPAHTVPVFWPGKEFVQRVKNAHSAS